MIGSISVKVSNRKSMKAIPRAGVHGSIADLVFRKPNFLFQNTQEIHHVHFTVKLRCTNHSNSPKTLRLKYSKTFNIFFTFFLFFFLNKQQQTMNFFLGR